MQSKPLYHTAKGQAYVGDLIISSSYNTAHQREKMNSTEERTLWRVTFQIPELIPESVRPDTL